MARSETLDLARVLTNYTRDRSGPLTPLRTRYQSKAPSPSPTAARVESEPCDRQLGHPQSEGCLITCSPSSTVERKLPTVLTGYSPLDKATVDAGIWVLRSTSGARAR